MKNCIFVQLLSGLLLLRRWVSGFRSPIGSGNADNGSNAGLAYFNGNYAPSTSNANLSSPHYL